MKMQKNLTIKVWPTYYMKHCSCKTGHFVKHTLLRDVSQLKINLLLVGLLITVTLTILFSHLDSLLLLA